MIFDFREKFSEKWKEISEILKSPIKRTAPRIILRTFPEHPSREKISEDKSAENLGRCAEILSAEKFVRLKFCPAKLNFAGWNSKYTLYHQSISK